MRKVFVLAPNEGWIVDRFVGEWCADNADISVTDPRQADVVWLMADWCWQRIPGELLASKRVITTVHHIVPEKFSIEQAYSFRARDALTTAYVVPNRHTEAVVRQLTQKPIHLIPYWANQHAFKRSAVPRGALRTKHQLPVDGYLVGSFQRDTEGHDLRTPKLEKGPDLLADALIKLANERPELHVVLGGWRRQYLIARLRASGIAYTCFERPHHSVLTELYQTLDLYPVTSRQEGGPQSLIECGLLGVPVVSRDVGMASQVLSPAAIADDVSLGVPEVPSVEHLQLPGGYQPYRQLIEAV